jgi:hypothetical protein
VAKIGTSIQDCTISLKAAVRSCINKCRPTLSSGEWIRFDVRLTFIGPCVVIYFYSTTNEMHQFLKFILFCSSTLHVSDGLSLHHQQCKTVHTASGVCQTDSAACLLAGTRWNRFSVEKPFNTTKYNPRILEVLF